MQALHKLQSSGLSNVSFEIGDLEECNFPDEFFDAILCSQAMFYVDLKSVSKRLHAWLKPGGILAYNTHQVLPNSMQCPRSSPALLCQLHSTAIHSKPACCCVSYCLTNTSLVVSI